MTESDVQIFTDPQISMRAKAQRVGWRMYKFNMVCPRATVWVDAASMLIAANPDVSDPPDPRASRAIRLS